MDQDYLAFGGDLPKVEQFEVYNEIGMEYKFTGQNEVVYIGLYYYGARYYDPAIGRFITEDTYPGEMDSSQSQNLYVYVMNNPLRYVDPSGHDPLGVIVDEDDDIDEVDKLVRYGMGYEDNINIKNNNTDIEAPNAPNYLDTPWYNESPWYTPVPDLANIDSSLYDDEFDPVFMLEKMLLNEDIQVLLEKLPKDEQIHVLGIGFGVSGGFVGAGQGDFLVALDDKGNIAFLNSLAGGYFIGKGATGGIRLLTSKADTVKDLREWGFTASFEFGVNGKTGSYSIGIGTNGEMTHTYGINRGQKPIFLDVDGSISAMISYSFVYRNKNIKGTKIYQNTIKPIFDAIQIKEIKIGIK